MRFRGGKPLVYGDPFQTGGAPGFSPIQLAPLVWVDFTDSSTITLNSGYIASITNKGSFGGSFAQAVAGNQPIYKSTSTGFSNQASAEFNGRYLTQAVYPAASAYTEYLVFRINAGITPGPQFTTSLGGYGFGVNVVSVIIGNNSVSQHFSAATSLGITLNGYAANKNWRRAYKYDATSTTPFGSPVRDIVNGSPVTAAGTALAAAPGTAGGGTWSIGANMDGAFPLYGEIHHCFIWDRAVSDADLARLDAWVVQRFTGSWG